MIELITIIVMFIFTVYLYKENDKYEKEIDSLKKSIKSLDMLNERLANENERLKEKLYGKKMELHNVG